MANNNKLVCIVGMCGAGKSVASDYLMEKRPFGYVRFGQVVMDVILEKGLPPSESLEKEIREDLRKKHGMAAMALLNLPKIESLLKQGDVIADAIYSWEEFLVLKEKFGDDLLVLAIFAPAKLRYARLAERTKRHAKDDNLRYRSFSVEEAAARDKAEIENLNKGGPIAMADYTVLNTGDLDQLYFQLDLILSAIF